MSNTKCKSTYGVSHESIKEYAIMINGASLQHGSTNKSPLICHSIICWSLTKTKEIFENIWIKKASTKKWFFFLSLGNNIQWHPRDIYSWFVSFQKWFVDTLNMHVKTSSFIDLIWLFHLNVNINVLSFD